MNSKQPAPWQIRAVQLDLARQRETLDTIDRFIAFAGRWGFNTLLLYLEGVVRTPSFDFRPVDQSYTLADMQHIVAAANRAGLDVVPCVSTLGHAEHFVECQELSHLRETDGWAGHAFCPSNPETYAFLEKYLTELMPVFPGKNFHIGCDEVWSIGSCPACSARVARGEVDVDLMLAHIQRMHRFITKMGKRAWIWPDMFENSPVEKIAAIPRDILLCAWHYFAENTDFHGFQGHFNNLHRRDWLKIYASLGFDVLVCSWTISLQGTLALTEVSRQRTIAGGLQTIWEMAGGFLPSMFPAVAIAGLWWSNPGSDGEHITRTALGRLLPSVDEQIFPALLAALDDDYWKHHAAPEYFLRGMFLTEETRFFHSLDVIENPLRQSLNRLSPGEEYDIVEQLHTHVLLHQLAGRLRKVLPTLIDPRMAVVDQQAQQQAIADLFHRFDELLALRQSQWQRLRPGIVPNHAVNLLRTQREQVEQFITHHLNIPREQRALLQARLFLQDGYSAPLLQIELSNDDNNWQSIFRGNFKPVSFAQGQYTLQVPFDLKHDDPLPTRVRFTVSNFGGQGVSYASVFAGDRELVPAEILSIQGQVTSHESILRDDSSVCFLGSSDTVRTLREHSHQNASSIVARLA